MLSLFYVKNEFRFMTVSTAVFQKIIDGMWIINVFVNWHKNLSL